MWIEIKNENDLKIFLNAYGGFHDCCLKELRYISGAFVNQNLEMHATNDLRKLSMVFQRQSQYATVIELEFIGLEKLNLCPSTEEYTCEILDVEMFYEENKIYWGDSEWFKIKRENYEGTWLCAQKARWRTLDKEIEGIFYSRN